MPLALRTRRFTADEYQRMGQVGILSPDDRVELIDGEVLAMSPIGPRHSSVVDRLNQFFNARLAGRAIVRIQGPVRLDLYTEPEPDVLLLQPRVDFYASGHPGPADALLIVEVAESSIGYDRDVKSYVYARSGVQEYWILDLNENAVIRHTSPEGGTYRVIESLGAGERLAPLLLADCVISVGDLLGV